MLDHELRLKTPGAIFGMGQCNVRNVLGLSYYIPVTVDDDDDD